MNRRVNPLARMRWLQFSNQSGSTIPAFAVMEIIGVDANGILQVTQPLADSIGADQIAFNSFLNIAAGKNGMCTQDWPAYCLFNAGDGTPANSQIWGTGASSWALRVNNNQTGFVIQGGIQGTGSGSRVMAGSANSQSLLSYGYFSPYIPSTIGSGPPQYTQLVYVPGSSSGSLADGSGFTLPANNGPNPVGYVITFGVQAISPYPVLLGVYLQQGTAPPPGSGVGTFASGSCTFLSNGGHASISGSAIVFQKPNAATQAYRLWADCQVTTLGQTAQIVTGYASAQQQLPAT